MELISCFLKANDCFKKNQKMPQNRPKGIVVHSTGVNNPNLKRYVQPLPTDKEYEALITELGVNRYGNSWNRSAAEMGKSVCVHAFIGKNARGEVRTVQTLPFTVCCWGVGSGQKGSYNNDPAYVQFEICEDDRTDRTYFEAAMTEARTLCAHLCTMYGLTADNIVSHQEAHKLGYGSNHSDPHPWLKKFDRDMDWFRAGVAARLNRERGIEPGDLVAIKPGSVYYSGKSIPHWVLKKTWVVRSVSGDRVVIDLSADGKESIRSPIHADALRLVP